MRIEQLTFTRFLAAFAIVVFHFGRDVFPFDYAIIQPTVLSLNIGVSYFFILSGFVITIAYSRMPHVSYLKFYLLRLVRIFPAFLISFILSVIYLSHIGENIDTSNYILQAFLIHVWFKEYCLSINFPSWSLCVELFFYFIFPITYNTFYKKTSLKKIAIAVVIIWVVSQCVFIFIQQSGAFSLATKKLSLYFPLLHLNQFMAGNLLALYLLHRNPEKKNNLLYTVIVAVVLMCLINLPVTQKIFHNGLIAPVFCMFIYLFSASENKLTTVFQLPFFILLGEISYGIYIYQYPVYKIFNFLYIKILQLHIASWMFYANFLILLIVSYYSYRFIEKPITSRLKNILQKK